MIPVFSARHVEAAVSHARAVEAVREAFVAYARGEWTMPPKVYVPAYPAGDFRAMPALGAGHALLKWVTSFPGNPALGLPTVTGLVLLSDASDGSLRAALDAGAVTALRTGAAAVLAAETLGRPDAETAAVIGAGVNGRGPFPAGRPDRTKINEPFFSVYTCDGICRGWGAWELKARYSYVDLNDGVNIGGRQEDFSTGVNWYLNSYCRIMFDYVHSISESQPATALGVAGATGGTANEFGTRFQIDF